MPLKLGKSKKIRSQNIAELLDSYKEKGMIGSSKPKNKLKALKQAIAISYSVQRKKGKK
jgi:hypothetical protein